MLGEPRRQGLHGCYKQMPRVKIGIVHPRAQYPPSRKHASLGGFPPHPSTPLTLSPIPPSARTALIPFVLVSHYLRPRGTVPSSTPGSSCMVGSARYQGASSVCRSEFSLSSSACLSVVKRAYFLPCPPTKCAFRCFESLPSIPALPPTALGFVILCGSVPAPRPLRRRAS